MDYKLKYDLHTHTIYSHGKGNIFDNAKVAYEKGMHMIGIADHGPGHKFYGINLSDIENMREDIKQAELFFPKLEVKLSVEANIASPSGKLDLSEEEKELFDYIIAGYHYGAFGEKPMKAIKVCMGSFWKAMSDRTYNTDMIVKALYENDIKLLTHPGDKIDVDIKEVAKACAATGTLMEINNHHNGLSVEDLEIAANYNRYFVISSDAHVPENVGTFDEALKRAELIGLPLERIINLWS